MDHGRNPAAALRTPLLRGRQLPKAVALALLLVGLSAAHLPDVGPGSVRAGSVSSLVTLTMSVQSCPGFPPMRTSPATEVSVEVPSSVVQAAASLQAWGSSPNVLLGPADFTCMAFFGSGDGGLSMDLVGADDACYAQSGFTCPYSDTCFAQFGYACPYYDTSIPPTDRVSAVFSPGGAVSPIILACPYFASAQAGLQALPNMASIQSSCASLPPGQVVQPLDANSVAFYQPAGDSHPSPTFGVVASNVAASDGGTTGASTEATCTMPASSSSVCQSVLIAFLTGWGQSYDPAADSAAVDLAALPWFSPTAVTAQLAPVDDSGVSGSASLVAADGGTWVTFTVTGLVPGAIYVTQLHAGTCTVPSASFTDLPLLTADATGQATASGPVLFHEKAKIPLANLNNGQIIAIASGLPNGVLPNGLVACGSILTAPESG